MPEVVGYRRFVVRYLGNGLQLSRKAYGAIGDCLVLAEAPPVLDMVFVDAVPEAATRAAVYGPLRECAAGTSLMPCAGNPLAGAGIPLA